MIYDIAKFIFVCLRDDLISMVRYTNVDGGDLSIDFNSYYGLKIQWENEKKLNFQKLEP